MLTEKEIETASAISPNYVPPTYYILETIDDRITKVTWHKILGNSKAIALIVAYKVFTHWEIKEEISGKRFIWVTDKLLTLLNIQGLQQAHD
jgi:hypothetical protein